MSVCVSACMFVWFARRGNRPWNNGINQQRPTQKHQTQVLDAILAHFLTF